MSTKNNEVKEEKTGQFNTNLFSKRVSWNNKRKYNYKYITSVF